MDSESLELTQAAMEDVLFTIVKAHGYGEETLHLYRMVSRCDLGENTTVARVPAPSLAVGAHSIVPVFFFFLPL